MFHIDLWKEISEVDKYFYKNYLSTKISHPPVNIYSNDEETEVLAEVPGIHPENIDISVKDNTLFIEGDYPAIESDENSTSHYNEIKDGHFFRKIQLSFKIDSEKIAANTQNGILTIKLPHSKESKPKKITVQSVQK